MTEALGTQIVAYFHDVLHSETADELMTHVHDILQYLGVPKPYPDAERIAIAMATGIFTLLAYFVLFGKRHRRRRRVLQEELDRAYEKVQELQEKMAEMEVEEETNKPKEQIRIWMDGAFDMMHYGHMNAFRQARSLGTYLVVGVNDDESITACKGAPPVLNNEERIASVAGCKFVNVVEPHCPYIMNEEYLKRMIKKHNIDYVVHGDDPCIVDGKDVYESAQKLGKYRTIPRTEGVSTSDILGRMLVMHKTHHTHEGYGNGQLSSQMTAKGGKSAYERPSKFLTTNRMLRLFSVGNHEPKKTDKIVYIDGAFDMFHAGHVEILKLAKAEGSYLIVGVHNDAVVNRHRGLNFPIMNLHERVLSVLGCKFVDDVLIDAPWQVTKEMVASLNISVVVHGTHRDPNHMQDFSLEDHYQYAREAGLFKLIKSPTSLDVNDIVARINDNRDRFEKKFVSKMKSEEEYYADRYSKKSLTQVFPTNTKSKCPSFELTGAKSLQAILTLQRTGMLPRLAPVRRLARVVSTPVVRFGSSVAARPHASTHSVATALAIGAVSFAALSHLNPPAFAAAPRKTMASADAIKAEELYKDNSNDRRELFNTLKAMHAANPQDVGVIWRLTRAAYDVANLSATPADEKKELTYYARDVIQKALDITDDVAEVHNWLGIMLSSIGDYEGSKVSIANSYVIKQHWEKSIELAPTHSTAYHLLGRWCIAIADLSWLERKAAAVLFGSPPESSYDEALTFLLKCDDLSPGTWKKNTLLIAQAYQKKKDWAIAKEWTNKAIAIPIETEEDQRVHDEATALLKKL